MAVRIKVFLHLAPMQRAFRGTRGTGVWRRALAHLLKRNRQLSRRCAWVARYGGRIPALVDKPLWGATLAQAVDLPASNNRNSPVRPLTRRGASTATGAETSALRDPAQADFSPKRRKRTGTVSDAPPSIAAQASKASVATARKLEKQLNHADLQRFYQVRETPDEMAAADQSSTINRSSIKGAQKEKPKRLSFKEPLRESKKATPRSLATANRAKVTSWQDLIWGKAQSTLSRHFAAGHRARTPKQKTSDSVIHSRPMSHESPDTANPEGHGSVRAHHVETSPWQSLLSAGKTLSTEELASLIERGRRENPPTEGLKPSPSNSNASPRQKSLSQPGSPAQEDPKTAAHRHIAWQKNPSPKPYNEVPAHKLRDISQQALENFFSKATVREHEGRTAGPSLTAQRTMQRLSSPTAAEKVPPAEASSSTTTPGPEEKSPEPAYFRQPKTYDGESLERLTEQLQRILQDEARRYGIDL